MDQSQNAGLYRGFWDSLRRWPGRPAVWAAGRGHTYAELAAAAGRLARAVGRADPDGGPVCVLGNHSFSAYAAVLGVLAAGQGYAPLNPGYPEARLLRSMEAAGSSVVVAPAEGEAAAAGLARAARRPLTFLLPDGPAPDGAAGGPHRWLGAEDLPPAEPPRPRRSRGLAYVMFTSGTTGRPKAVAVGREAAAAYLAYVARRYRPVPGDRFSQVFDLTFDLSVHDLFLAWHSGAACYALGGLDPKRAAEFIAEHRLTMWFSTPSLAMLMAQAGALGPGSLPSLRWSLFCGEALPAATARSWQAAAPGSLVENLYGPTEATIAISHYRWDPDESPRRCLQGVVPLGKVFRGQRWKVMGPGLTEAVPGSRGELLLSGSQVARGYLDNPEQTAESFFSLDGEPGLVWYRTGDMVQADPDGVLHFLGRTDRQVQVQGQRVELQEVDQALREAAGTDLAVAVAWPRRAGPVEALFGFVARGAAEEDPARREAEIIERLESRLPDHMIPRRVHFLSSLPRNAHGKLDREALSRRLEKA